MLMWYLMALFIDPTKAAHLLMVISAFDHSGGEYVDRLQYRDLTSSVGHIAFVTTSKHTGKPIKITIICLYWTSIYFAVALNCIKKKKVQKSIIHLISPLWWQRNECRRLKQLPTPSPRAHCSAAEWRALHIEAGSRNFIGEYKHGRLPWFNVLIWFAITFIKNI